MDVTVGAVLEGKVTGIMKFGAFVSLPGGKSGLVHISEIAYTYVNQVSDFLQVGQEVRVKVIGIDDAGRINLSIKKAAEASAPQERRKGPPSPVARTGGGRSSAPPSFEDKLKQFMADSDSRMSGVRQYSENKKRRGRKADFDDDYD